MSDKKHPLIMDEEEWISLFVCVGVALMCVVVGVL